jgi:hypothetical protein
MKMALAETDALLRELDDEADPDAIRGRAAALLDRLLSADNAPLGLWQKIHFEMAIALLPTVWLRLCLTHLRIAQEEPDADVLAEIAASRGAEFDGLTRSLLLERLDRVIAR